MNTRAELDRIVVDWLAYRTVDPPHGSLDEALEQVAVVPQERFGRLGAWRDRLVRLLRGPDPFGDRPSRDRLALGALAAGTGLAVLVLTATLFLPGDGGRLELGPAAVPTHVVAADGSGDFTTIAEAVAAAADGDRIVIEPGTYTESIVVDKDIELRGDLADPGAVVVRVPDDGPVVDVGERSIEPMRYAFLLRDSDASVGHLSIEGPLWYTSAIIVEGGQPTIHDLVATVMEGACESGFLTVRAGASGTVRDNRSNGCAFVGEGSSPVMTGNTFDSGVAVGDPGSAPLISGNRLGSVTIGGGASVEVVDNEAIPQDVGCWAAVYEAGTSATIRGNRVEDSSHGVCAYEGTTVRVEGNTLTRNVAGIDIAADDAVVVENVLTDNLAGVSITAADATVERNRVRGGRSGIVISGEAAPSLVENTVEGSGRGVSVGRASSPLLAGNELCGNEEDLWIAEGASPQLDGNTICGAPADLGASAEPGLAGSTHVVAGDGSGDFATIAEAVAAARDGDTLLIEPGTYEEALRIDKAITLQGGGDQPGDVVIAMPEDAPPPSKPIAPLRWEFEAPMSIVNPPTGIELSGAGGSLRNLQVEGHIEGVAVLARRGVHELGNVVIGFPGLAESCTCDHMAGALFVTDAAEVAVTDSELWYRAIVDGGAMLSIKDSKLWYARVGAQGASTLSLENDAVHGDESASSIVILDGSAADIRSSTIDTFGIRVGSLNADGTTAHIEGNTVRDVGDSAVWVSGGARVTVVGNVISDSAAGVNAANAEVEVRDNELIGNASGIVLNATDAMVSGNELRGGKVGITIFGGNRSDGGSQVTIEANTIEGMASRGISIGPGTTPVVTRNTICTDGQDIAVHDDADPVLSDNESCDARPTSE